MVSCLFPHSSLNILLCSHDFQSSIGSFIVFSFLSFFCRLHVESPYLRLLQCLACFQDIAQHTPALFGSHLVVMLGQSVFCVSSLEIITRLCTPLRSSSTGPSFSEFYPLQWFCEHIFPHYSCWEVQNFNLLAIDLRIDKEKLCLNVLSLPRAGEFSVGLQHLCTDIILMYFCILYHISLCLDKVQIPQNL